jgi:hypothetical protein
VRAIGLIFLTLGCAASAVGAAGAGQSVAAPPQAPSRSTPNAVGSRSHEADHAAPPADGTRVGKPSQDQQNHREVSGNKPSPSNTSPSKANHRNEVPNRRERSASQDSKNSIHPGSDKSAGATQNGLVRNETVNHAASKRASNTARPTVPSLSSARHRGANPAIVGGAGNSNSRNTGALDGTHMNRRRTGN